MSTTLPGATRPDLLADPVTVTALSTGAVALRRLVLGVAVAGLRAADPGAATRRTLTYDATTDLLTVGDHAYPLHRRGRVLLVGAGKASHPIAVAVTQILGERLAGGVVVVRDPAAAPVPPLQVRCADHPLPSARSAAAAEAILAVVADAGPDDLVLSCFTGGSSALASLPPAGVSLADKRELHRVLLASGLAITDVNAVRKQVSRVKGGRVAELAAPAVVVNLTVSDVAGSPLDAVTDPVVPDTSTSADARRLLREHGLWERVPSSVRQHLEADLPTPVLAVVPQTVMLADGPGVTLAMAEAARAAGWRAHPVLDELEGDAAVVVDRLAEQVVSARQAGRPVMVVGCGGEATVTLADDGAFGAGGPNQQCALLAAQRFAGEPVAAVFLDTDGSDGGTAYAGAVVDGGTAADALRRGVDLADAVAARHSSRACELLGSAVRLGHTGTNVNDLFVIAVGADDAPRGSGQ